MLVVNGVIEGFFFLKVQKLVTALKHSRSPVFLLSECVKYGLR